MEHIDGFICEFDGELTVDEINEQVAILTGDSEPIFCEEDEDWKLWVTYKDGKTIIADPFP